MDITVSMTICYCHFPSKYRSMTEKWVITLKSSLATFILVLMLCTIHRSLCAIDGSIVSATIDRSRCVNDGWSCTIDHP